MESLGRRDIVFPKRFCIKTYILMCGQSVGRGIFGAQNSCAVVDGQLHCKNTVNLQEFGNRKAEVRNRKAGISNQRGEVGNWRAEIGKSEA